MLSATEQRCTCWSSFRGHFDPADPYFTCDWCDAAGDRELDDERQALNEAHAEAAQ
ncbi:MAG TPA: hypothetical protein VM915_15260 [Verrucomicrobiae bacterium]|nr:hypothetical protein [Verrucomicrobiae bacterium]